MNNRTKNKLNIYSGAPVDKGFYERNLNKAKTVYLTDNYQNPKKYLRKREEKAFNKVLNNYFNDYKKLQEENFFQPKKTQNINHNSIDINKFELKKRSLNSLFFQNDIKNNKNIDFSKSDQLLYSMNDYGGESLLLTTQIKKDYEMRLKIEDMNKMKNNNMNIIEDNFDFNKKNEDDNDKLLGKNKNIKKELESIEENKNEPDNNLEEKNNELEMLKNKITDNSYPLFEQIIFPYFKTEYKPPPVFPKIEEEEEKYIIDKELTNNNNNDNKELNTTPNQMKNENIEEKKDDEKKMLNQIIKDEKYPFFEDIINPYFMTKYTPPEVFPKIEKEEKKDNEEEDKDDYNDFDQDIDKKVNDNNKNDNNKNDNNSNLIKLKYEDNTKKDAPMLDNLIKYDSKENKITEENKNKDENILVNQEKKKELENKDDNEEYNDFET